MGIKLIVKDNPKIQFDLIRGAQIPREGDVVRLVPRGKKQEKQYMVYLVDHLFDLNKTYSSGNTTIFLEEIKKKEK